MLNSCFKQMPNERKRVPRATPVGGPLPGTNFESRAFTALWNNSKSLKIRELWRCNSARHDGYLETTKGEIILLEMKECLGWGALQAASAEFLMGKGWLDLEAQRAIIVFERVSREWSQIRPYGAWGQLALHSSEFSPYLQIGGLQVLRDGAIRTSPGPDNTSF